MSPGQPPPNAGEIEADAYPRHRTQGVAGCSYRLLHSDEPVCGSPTRRNKKILVPRVGFGPQRGSMSPESKILHCSVRHRLVSDTVADTPGAEPEGNCKEMEERAQGRNQRV